MTVLMSELLTMPSDKRKKLSKTDLLKSIDQGAYVYEYNQNRTKEAEKKLTDQALEEKLAKDMIVAYLDLPLTEESRYGGEVDIKYSLLPLIGKLLATFSK